MTLADFHARYGASCRKKYLVVLPSTVGGWVGFAARLLVGRLRTDKRFYALPARTALPPEFIRLDPWEAEYLFLVASLARKGIVEIGRHNGGSTFLLACANSEVPIWSIDIAPQDDDRLRRLLAEHGVGRNVDLIVGDSQRGEFPEIGAYDLLFVDGDHSYEGCMADLEKHFPGLEPGGHLVLHDCYAGLAVQPAVFDFVARRDVTVVRSPYIIASHWHTSYGSMAHFRKGQPPG